MNSPVAQDQRRSKLTTEPEKDKLVLLCMNGTEELSGSFQWDAEALSADDGIVAEACRVRVCRKGQPIWPCLTSMDACRWPVPEQ